MSRTGQRLYDALEPITGPDEKNGWPLAHFCNGYAAMLDDVAQVVSDTDDGVPGWAWLFDIDNAPAEWLPYLEWFAGVVPYPALDDAARRTRLKETDGRRRGTVPGIKGAARQFLAGGQFVFVIQRDSGPYHYTVVTRLVETPFDPLAGVSWDQAPGVTWDSLAAGVTWDQAAAGAAVAPARLWEALEEQRPAGFSFKLLVAAGQVWDEIATGVTWGSVAAGVTWDSLIGTTTV